MSRHYHSAVLPLASPAVSVQLDNTRGMVRRVAVRETTGTSYATVEVYDGSGTNGVLLDVITLSPNQSARDPYRVDEYPYYGGLYISVVAGSVKGSFTVWHWHDYENVGEPVVMINPEVFALQVPGQ